MIRGYRSIVGATVGLALVGAGEPPKRVEQAEKQPTQSELAKAPTTISTAISRLQIPVEENPSCQPGKDNRNSDLCAQWKAADAARDAAEYAFWTMLLGFGGTVLLVLTFWETRRATRAQLRAYLSIEPEPLVGLPDKPAAKICMRNAGSTPAHGAKFSLIGRVDDPDLSEQAINELHGRVVATSDNEMLIAAQQELFRPLPILDGINEVMLDACRDGTRWLYIVGRVTYTDVFEKERHTWFCHTYSGPNLRPGIYRFGNRGD